jgi:glycosyltransferase involved in cell wall biosynthesis
MHGIGVDTEWYTSSAVTPESSRTAIANAGIDADRPYFVAVGELNRNKRPTDIVRALAHMSERKPAVLFLGEGPERNRVTKLAQELGVAGRVGVPGRFIADVRPLVAPAIALVQASKREGLPRSIMEAYALEVPVITTAARGCRELVEDDRGRVVPIGGIREMAAAMDHLYRNPSERREMGSRGRRLMIERYALQQITMDHERLYSELLDMARDCDKAETDV